MQAVADFAREHDLTHVIDNTFATPVLLRPAELGFIVIHSATKFLNGHSDILAGAVSGPAAFIAKARAASHPGQQFFPAFPQLFFPSHHQDTLPSTALGVSPLASSWGGGLLKRLAGRQCCKTSAWRR